LCASPQAPQGSLRKSLRGGNTKRSKGGNTERRPRNCITAYNEEAEERQRDGNGDEGSEEQGRE
jgi:hypothetical protein